MSFFSPFFSLRLPKSYHFPHYIELTELRWLPQWLSGKESACNAGDMGSIPGKISWRKKWQPTLVFLPGKSHGQKEPGRPQPVDLQNSWTQLGNETIETEELLVSTVKSNQSVCAKTTLYNFVLMHLYKIIRVPCS